MLENILRLTNPGQSAMGSDDCDYRRNAEAQHSGKA